METTAAQGKANPRFDGVTYDPARDADRLRRQLGRVYEVMADGRWRSLWEISRETGDPETSISAQVRNLRKARFGGYVVERRLRTWQGHSGTFEYRLLVASKGGQR